MFATLARDLLDIIDAPSDRLIAAIVTNPADQREMRAALQRERHARRARAGAATRQARRARASYPESIESLTVPPCADCRSTYVGHHWDGCTMTRDDDNGTDSEPCC